MPFRVKDILIVNATVIIGLLILLTFQSISSSFIETETSNFNKKWRDIMMLENVNWELQQDCKLLNDDRAAYEDWFVDFHTEYDEDGSISFRAYDHLSKEMENEIKKRCSELVVEGLETYQRMIEVEYDGYYLNYLQQYDDDGNVYIWESGDGDEWDPDRYSEESDYFDDIVSGPFYVNVINVLMILPFTASAIIASFNAFRKNEETNKASRAAVFAMGAGFCVMIVGFLTILVAFHQVYAPFL